MNRLGLLLLLIFTTNLFAASQPHWDDSARIAVIWNRGTGSAEMPPNWDQQVGEIGEATRDFVMEALKPVVDANKKLNLNNIKVYSGDSLRWKHVAQSVDNLKDDFGGRSPHAIIYINAGYVWDDHISGSKSPAPHDLLIEAADSGIGIVAIGDDAAYEGKKIFNLIGPIGKDGKRIKDPIQYEHSTAGTEYPWMNGGTNWNNWNGPWEPTSGFKKLFVWLDTTANKNLPDNGLLWNVNVDTLTFKPWEKDGRGQLDADIYEVADLSKLDRHAFVGFQQGNGEAGWVKESWDQKDQKLKRYYKALTALQDSLNRIVMIGYQPQYVEEKEASLQIVYNSTYWASKAREMLKISMPEATPPNGTIQTVNSVLLTVADPTDKKLYDIYYTLDGATPTKSSDKYTGSIPLPNDKGDVTLKAIAFSNDPDHWFDSDMLEVTYKDVKQQISTPKASPPNGGVFSVGDIVLTVDTPTDGSLYDIFYTVDGSTPNESKTKFNGTLTLPQDASGAITLKAIAISKDKKNWKNSEVAVFTYDHNTSKIGTPMANPSSGKIHEISTISLKVSFPSDESLYTIYYTVDGSTPSKSNGTPYTGGITLPNTDKDITLKAIAISEKPNQYEDSDVAEFTYDYVLRQIATPEADPASGTTQSVDRITLTVREPDESLWTIFYTLDGTTPTRSNSIKYNGTFPFPEKPRGNVTLKAIAFSDQPTQWADSKMLEVIYTYVGGPLVDSAHFRPGSIKDFKTSNRKDDTLVVFFNESIRETDNDRPFSFKDAFNSDYSMTMWDQEYDGRQVTFIVTDFTDKENSYLPVDGKDSIAINPDAAITSTTSGFEQDGSNNFYVPLRVFAVPIDLSYSATWLGDDSSGTMLNEVITSATGSWVEYQEGLLMLIDPKAPLQESEYREFDFSLAIYDMVGNKVIASNRIDDDNTQLKSTVTYLNNRPQVAVAWDGTNASRRRVGGGSYKCLFVFTDQTGREHPKTIMLSLPFERRVAE